MRLIIKILFIFLCVFVLALNANAQVRVIDNKGTIQEIDASKWWESGNNIYNKNSANVIIGKPKTFTPVARFTVSSGTSGLPPFQLDTPFTGNLADDILTWNTSDMTVQKISVATLNSGDWHTLGNAGTTAGTNFLGTTDPQDLVFKTNNTEKIRLTSNGYLGIGTSTPATRLEINNATAGAIKIVDGTQGAGKVLTSDANGVGQWANASSDWTTTGNGGTNPSTNFIGTTDNQPLQFKINSINAGRLGGNGTTAFGYMALNPAGTGANNTALGERTLQVNTTGNNNVAVGINALAANTTGYSNVSVGSGALAANTTGYSNVAVGFNALSANTIGVNNLAFGQSTLLKNVSGIQNLAIGWGSLMNSTSDDNTAVGYATLNATTTGTANTVVGAGALQRNTTGSNNVAAGYGAGQGTTTGFNNVTLGSTAGQTNVTGSNNTFVGTGADATSSSTNLTNAAAIGYGARVGASNSLVLGGTGANAVNVGIGNSIPNNKLEITQGTTGNSGLRFTNLTTATTPTLGSDKFLTVDTNGDVVLRNVGENIVDFTSSDNNPNTAGTTFTPNDIQNRDVIYSSTGDNSLWKWTGSIYVAYTPTSTAWLQGGNAVTVQRNLGTVTNFNLPIVTNNIPRMTVLTSATVQTTQIGVATTTPAFTAPANTGTTIPTLGVDGTVNATNYTTPVQPPFSGATVTWDMSKGSTAKWTMAAGANTLTVSNMKAGMYGTIICTNNGTSTLTFSGGVNKVINGSNGIPTLTPAANAVDILSFLYDGTTFWWTVGNNYN